MSSVDKYHALCYWSKYGGKNMSQLNKNLDMKKIYSNYTFVFSFLVLVIIATVINHSFLSWTNLSTLMLQSSIKG